MATEIQTTTYKRTVPVSTVVTTPTTTRVVRTRSVENTLSALIWFLLGFLEIFLGLRIIFLLLNANPSAGFTNFVYDLTQTFVEPFQGIFPAPSAGSSYLDTAAIVAMVVYAIFAWGIIEVIELIDRRIG